MMFEAAEVGQKLSKQAFSAQESALRVDLLNAQFDLGSTRSPVIVLIAGDDRPGAAAVLNRLHEWMDGRYLDTHAFGPHTEAERLRPPMWRYWTALPRRGRVAIYLGGWAQNPLAARLEGVMGAADFERAVDRFRSFEEELAADGAVLVKLWIHLPKREHEKRLSKVRKERGDVWRVDEIDWHICDNYDDIAPLAEELIVRTTTAEAPWHVVEATDARYRDITCARFILEALQRAVAPDRLSAPSPASLPALPPRPSVLDEVDLSARLEPEDYKPRLEKLQRRLGKLADRGVEESIRTVLVFEGWDAAGKGGVIRRTTRALDARDYRVVRTGAPTEEEHRYHYLWRFWRRVPRAGQLVIFDRSWYGRVLVERVEGFASQAEWQRAYAEINDFERQLSEANTVLIKFWLHLDREEQLRRFADRERTPYKKYKITDEDYRNRDQWSAYVAAVHDMVERTSTPTAPWYLISANDKRHARVRVLETVCDALKSALGASR